VTEGLGRHGWFSLCVTNDGPMGAMKLLTLTDISHVMCHITTAASHALWLLSTLNFSFETHQHPKTLGLMSLYAKNDIMRNRHYTYKTLREMDTTHRIHYANKTFTFHPFSIVLSLHWFLFAVPVCESPHQSSTMIKATEVPTGAHIL
jgi:hypothetical protein